MKRQVAQTSITNIFLLFLVVLLLPSVLAQSPQVQPQQAVLVSSSTPQIGREFVVELNAYPTLPRLSSGSVRFNNYNIVIYYDPNALEHVASQNKIEGFNIDQEGKSSGYISLSASQPFGAYFTNSPTLLATFTFVPKTSGSSEVTLNKVEIENSLGESGRSALVITQLQSLSVQAQSSGSACVPNCAGRQCGTDGCGGSCGTCSPGALGSVPQCVNGQCQCISQCSGRECGSDGCGGSCGTCIAGGTCLETATTARCSSGVGQVVPSTSTPSSGVERGPQLPLTTQSPTPPVPPQEGISSSVWIGLGLLVLGLVVGVFFYIYLKKKPSAPSSQL